jgi:hypothetical protein
MLSLSSDDLVDADISNQARTFFLRYLHLWHNSIKKMKGISDSKILLLRLENGK